MSRIDSPLIGSGSQEEVDLRVQALLDLGTSRGYLTYEELNERLPDEVVSPDKLDSLLMMIDEMGIKLIDEGDVGEFQKPGSKPKPEKIEKPAAAPVSTQPKPERPSRAAAERAAKAAQQPQTAADEEADEDDDDDA